MSGVEGKLVNIPIVCAFDQTVHADLTSLHAHLKRFRVSRAKYYSTYSPRFDKLTGEPIPFKDFDQYFSQDFLSKINLRKWLAKYPVEGLEWSKAWLARRRAEKGLIYAPSQAELRTLQCPTMPYYESVGAAEGGYYGITRVLGYKDRYTIKPLVFTPIPKDACVIQDTREKSPITLSHRTIIGTLNVGDYAITEPHDMGVRIERKSLADLCSTLSAGRSSKRKRRKEVVSDSGTTPDLLEDSHFQRFERELIRAQEHGLYVVMMVEASITDAQRFDYLPQTQWIKASPSHIFHNLRDLLSRYPLTFQCVFCNGRVEMARIMMKVFQLGATVRTIDLQHALESNLL